jgi:hypothetical protein
VPGRDSGSVRGYDGLMIRSDRVSSPEAPRWALLLSLLLPACGPATPDAAPPPSPSAASDDAPVHHVAEAALNSLTRRKFNVAGCAPAEARVVTEAEAAAPPPGGERCAMLVAHRPDKTWVVVVRSPAQPGNVWAVVSVSPGGDGVVHIDYKP